MATLSQADLNRTRLALNNLSAHAQGELRALWAHVDPTDWAACRHVLEPVWPDLIGDHGKVAAQLATDTFDAWAAEAKAKAAPAPVRPVDVGRAQARLRWAIGQPNQLGNLQNIADELVKQPYRSTMAKAAAHAGVRFARVPTGAFTCPFCGMLASRGAVYHTQESAGAANKYHGNCDCTPVPIKDEDDYPEGYDPDVFMQQYLDARDKANSGDTGDILKAWGEMNQAATAAKEAALQAAEAHTSAPEQVHVSQAATAAADAVQPAPETPQPPPNDPLAGVDLDAMSLDDLDALMGELSDRGEWAAVERVAEYADRASQADAAPGEPAEWRPDPGNPFHEADRTFEWFEDATEDEQWDFLDNLAAPSEQFLQEQYAWKTGREQRARLTNERDLREQFEWWLESELQQLEASTNGVTLTREARAAGHRPRDLYSGNDRTAYAWASEETKAYWEAHGGRMTWGRFKATADGGQGAADARYSMGKQAGAW